VLRHAAGWKKRRSLAVPALFLCLLFAGCSRATPSVCGIDPAGKAPQKVARVVDGDTLHLAGGDKVRLIGINTPEMGRDGRPPEPLAEKSRMELLSLIGGREQVLLVDGRDARDRYGRRLAHLYDLSGRNLTAEMLRAGMGFQVAVSPNFGQLDCLRNAEMQARRARSGVWSQPDFAPVAVNELAPGQGGFTRVTGKVTRVSFKKNGWWIQLDGSLGLQIKSADQDLFDRGELGSLEGTMLQARGWLVPMKGDWWLMKISHPIMLEYEADGR